MAATAECQGSVIAGAKACGGGVVPDCNNKYVTGQKNDTGVSRAAIVDLSMAFLFDLVCTPMFKMLFTSVINHSSCQPFPCRMCLLKFKYTSRAGQAGGRSFKREKSYECAQGDQPVRRHQPSVVPSGGGSFVVAGYVVCRWW